MKNFAARVGIVCLTVFFLSGQAGAQFFVPVNRLIGEKAPDFTLKNTNDQEINLRKYIEGQKAIIFFWATWCPHCRRELLNMGKKKDEFEQKGIKIILVDLGEKKGPVAAYVKKYKVPFDVLLDTNSDIADLYALIGVPTFFFIDEKNNVMAVEHMMPDDYEKLLTPKVAQQENIDKKS